MKLATSKPFRTSAAASAKSAATGATEMAKKKQTRSFGANRAGAHSVEPSGSAGGGSHVVFDEEGNTIHVEERHPGAGSFLSGGSIGGGAGGGRGGVGHGGRGRGGSHVDESHEMDGDEEEEEDGGDDEEFQKMVSHVEKALSKERQTKKDKKDASSSSSSSKSGVTKEADKKEGKKKKDNTKTSTKTGTKKEEKDTPSKTPASAAFTVDEVLALGGDKEDHEWLMDVDTDDNAVEIMVDGKASSAPASSKDSSSTKKKPNKKKGETAPPAGETELSESEIASFIQSLGLKDVAQAHALVEEEDEEEEDANNNDDDDGDDGSSKEAAKSDSGTSNGKQQQQAQSTVTAAAVDDEALFQSMLAQQQSATFTASAGGAFASADSLPQGISRAKRDKTQVLLPRMDGRWFEADYVLDAAKALKSVPPAGAKVPLSVLQARHAFAEATLTADIAAMDALKSKRTRGKGDSDAAWLSTVMQSGTLTDKIAALIVQIQESPVHKLSILDTLLAMAKKKGKREAILALDNLQELFVSNLLPDRKLVSFEMQPHHAAAGVITDRHLALWYFEDALKRKYAEFVSVVLANLKDQLPEIRSKMIRFTYELLKNKPELERPLLAVLVNKVGDSDKKLASKVAFLLSNLLVEHPNMKLVVVKEVEQLVLRPKISERAQYYGVCFLNQIILTNDNVEVAAKLIAIYFTLFQLFVSHDIKDVEAKMLSALLTGVNRAYPFALPALSAVEQELLEKERERQRQLQQEQQQQQQQDQQGKQGKQGKRAKDRKSKDGKKEKSATPALPAVSARLPPTVRAALEMDHHMDTLFKVAHMSNFNTSIQALMLLFQVINHRESLHLTDRYYRALYDRMLDANLVGSNKHALFLNLMFRALKADDNLDRIKAFTKRLMQICGYHQPHFICGALIVVSEVAKLKPALITLIIQPEAEDEDETFRDVDEDEDGQLRHQKTKKPNGNFAGGDESDQKALTFGLYDPLKREPKYARASDSCLWELTAFSHHFHPSVASFAQSLLSAKPIEYKGDALQDFTLMRFLDRFSFKNPKNKPPTHGASIMQPHQSKNAREFQAPVNSKQFLAAAPGAVPADEKFYWTFFQKRAEVDAENSRAAGKKKKAAKGDLSALDNVMALDDFEDSMDSGKDLALLKDGRKGSRDDDDDDDDEDDEDDEDDDEESLVDFAGDGSDEEDDDAVEDKIGQFLQSKKRSAKDAKLDDEDEDEDDEDDEDGGFSYDDLNDDDDDDDDDEDGDEDGEISEKELEKILLNSLESDEEDALDTKPKSAKQKSKKARRDEEDEGDDDDDDDDEFDTSKIKGAMRSSAGNVFASADDFAHLLENSGAVNVKERDWQFKKMGRGGSKQQQPAKRGRGRR